VVGGEEQATDDRVQGKGLIVNYELLCSTLVPAAAYGV
jgi:hypothetical protein